MKPATPGPNQKFRVLVVEDELEVARLLCTTLSAANLECFHAPDGEAGFEAFKKAIPHLVLLDVMVPGMNGRDLLVKIRETSLIPAIMLSALQTDDDQVQGFKLGADDYIAKPFNPKLLVARVVANLRRAYRYDAPDADFQNGSAPTQRQGTGAGVVSAAAQQMGRMAPPSAPGMMGTPQTVPPGWATCDRCGYMGPRLRFENENALGRLSLVCPNCGEADHIVFSIG